MRALATTCSRGIALLLVCLFILSSLLLGVIIAFDRTFLDPDVLVDELTKAQFYHQFHAAVSDQIVYAMSYDPCQEDPGACQFVGEAAQNEGEGGPPENFKNLDRSDWSRLLEELLPPEWLEAQTTSLMTQLNDQIDNPQANRGIFLDMTGFKRRLAGDAGLQSVFEVIRAQPPCEASELESQLAMMDPASVDVGLPDCRLPDEVLEMSRPVILTLLTDASNDIPDQVDLGLGNSPTADLTFSGGEPDLITLLFWVRRIGRYGPLFPLSLLGLIALFAVRSWTDLFNWWGVPFVVTGLIGAGASFTAPALLDWGVERLLSEGIPKGLSPSFVEFGLHVVQGLLGGVSRWIRFGGIGLTLSGFALLGLSRLPWLGGEPGPRSKPSP